MQRYFFDVRTGDKLATDEEGMMLPSLTAVQTEASKSLAELARDMIRLQSGHHLAVEVRDASGSIVNETRLQWSMQARPGRVKGFKLRSSGEQAILKRSRCRHDRSVVRLHGLVAFAGGILQAFDIEDMYLPSGVLDQASLLQS